MNLQEKLPAIDPATLEAGCETDALVAACLGWKQVAGYAGCWWEAEPGKAYADLPLFSTDPGVAFSVLWPWLLERDDALCLTLAGNMPALPSVTIKVITSTHAWEVAVSKADTWALALCRAVVAVAKADSHPSK